MSITAWQVIVCWGCVRSRNLFDYEHQANASCCGVRYKTIKADESFLKCKKTAKIHNTSPYHDRL